MDKKLQKYIERYEVIQNTNTHTLVPNGGMSVFINQENACDIVMANKTHVLEPFEAVLLNAYEDTILIQSKHPLNFLAIRFKGAGASFFYEEQMQTLMQSPNEPIFIEKNLSESTIEIYLKNRLSPSQLPFNIMKIIALLDQQGIDYNIDEILAIANIPRKILDKIFNLRTGLTFKAYAGVRESSHENLRTSLERFDN
ncbi:MAG: hypothetical protein Q9M36_07180 [Sulfurovum sp.]|nr:hypothetical protein [Sulfurovum sp.]